MKLQTTKNIKIGDRLTLSTAENVSWYIVTRVNRKHESVDVQHYYSDGRKGVIYKNQGINCFEDTTPKTNAEELSCIIARQDRRIKDLERQINRIREIVS